MGNRGFSGIHYDQQFNRLTLLSDESKQLVAVGLDGLVSSRLKLQTGFRLNTTVGKNNYGQQRKALRIKRT